MENQQKSPDAVIAKKPLSISFGTEDKMWEIDISDTIENWPKDEPQSL